MHTESWCEIFLDSGRLKNGKDGNSNVTMGLTEMSIKNINWTGSLVCTRHVNLYLLGAAGHRPGPDYKLGTASTVHGAYEKVLGPKITMTQMRKSRLLNHT